MMPANVELGFVVYVVFLYTEIIYGFETNSGLSLAMDTMTKDVCNRTLSRLIFQIYTGMVQISDLPSDLLSTHRESESPTPRQRSQRAAVLFNGRLKKQVATNVVKGHALYRNLSNIARILGEHAKRL